MKNVKLLVLDKGDALTAYLHSLQCVMQWPLLNTCCGEKLLHAVSFVFSIQCSALIQRQHLPGHLTLTRYSGDNKNPHNQNAVYSYSDEIPILFSPLYTSCGWCRAEEEVPLLLDLALVMNLELCALDLLSAYLPSSKSKENNFPILTSFLSILHL